MYMVIRTHIRPSVDIPFFDLRSEQGSTPEFKEYFRINYIDTEKNLMINSDVSTDGLELSATSIWDSEESFNDYMNDPICLPFITAAREYLSSNGITETVTINHV